MDPATLRDGHRDVAVHPQRRCSLRGQERGGTCRRKRNRRLWLNSLLLPVQACVHLPAGEVLELRAQGSIGELEVGRQVAAVLEVTERPAAWFSSGPSLFDALGNDELGAIIGQLGGHSTDTYALAATCRAGRAAVRGGWRR